MVITCMAISLVSCSEDEPDPNNPLDYGSQINKSYDVTYTVNVIDPDVLRDIADLQIEYFDDNGIHHIDTITESVWEKRYFFNISENVAIGLKARWIFHDREKLDALVASESQKPAELQNTYNFKVDISSPYVTIKADDRRIESVFSAQISPNMDDKSYTAAAIVEGKLDQHIYTEWYWHVKNSNNVLILTDSTFPIYNVGFNVTYTAKSTDSKVIRDIADLEVTYIDSKGNEQTQLITTNSVFQANAHFSTVGDIVAMKARYVFRDRAILDEWLAKEMSKKESDRQQYSFALEISNIVDNIQSDGGIKEERLVHTLSSDTYTADEIVETLLDKDFSIAYKYIINKEGNNLILKVIE